MIFVDEQTMKIPKEIRDYLENLLKDAQMTPLDEEMHEEMIMQLYRRLDTFLNATIMNHLPPKHMDAFIKINEEKKSQAEIEQFLKENMPNAQDVFAQAFVDFRKTYLGDSKSKDSN